MSTAILLSELERMVRLNESGFKNLFWDWFCKGSALENRGARLAPKVLAVAEALGYDFNETKVDFKNNFPVVGNLYDSCQFHDSKSGELLACFTPASGHDHDKQYGTRAQCWEFAKQTYEDHWRAKNTKELIKKITEGNGQ